MKQFIQFSLLILGLMIAMPGCDAANGVKDKAADMANVDFGDFDMDGLKEKMSGITDGIKDVSSDNVEGLTSKFTDFTSSLDGMGIDSLPGPAKTAVTTALTKFGDTIKAAMDGISDDGILGKLKPVVEALMEKIKAMK